MTAGTSHVFIGGRCEFCGVNDLDNDLYGPRPCADRSAAVWTSSSSDSGFQSEAPGLTQRIAALPEG